jgi:hypothetical protein
MSTTNTFFKSNTRNFTIFLSLVLILTFSISFLYRMRPIGVLAQSTTPLSEKSPNYFYNRESAFIIKNALDSENGGMYLAVDKDGSKIDTVIPGEVWAYEANTLRGTDKTQVGQATCIRFFINEALRTKENGVDGINALLPKGEQLNSSNDVLAKAKICADFAIDKMEIGNAQDGTYNPNVLFYWGVVSADGTTKYDDSDPKNTTETYRSESSLTWSLAELALAMKNAGFTSTEYAKYETAAIRWYNWRTQQAVDLNETFSKNLTPGAGRDLYYPALGFVLSELTGNNIYREGNGAFNNDGSKNGAIPFANSQLGTGSAPIMNFDDNNDYALQEQLYTAALPRGTIFAKASQLNEKDIESRNQWWDFGWNPIIEGNDPNYSIKKASSFSDEQLSQAFKHTGGRELLAGVLKSVWFYSTYGVNPESFYGKGVDASNILSTSNFANATKEYWDVLNSKLWDDTAGQQAWLEAIGAPYKPCFSGDNDIPFGDWKKPTIVDKVHSINSDNSATVTVSGVNDFNTPYLSDSFSGSGIKKVETVYSLDTGKTWTTIPGNFNGTNYISTIPTVSPGTTVYYYAKTVDNFNNWTAFPSGSETWNDSSVTLVQDYTKAQTYTIPNPQGGFGGDTPTTGGPSTAPVTTTDPAVSPINSNPTSTVPAKPPTGFGGDAPTGGTAVNALIRTGGAD